MSRASQTVYECIIPAVAAPPIRLRFNDVRNNGQRGPASIVITSGSLGMGFSLQELSELKNQIEIVNGGGVEAIAKSYRNGHVIIRSRTVAYSMVPAASVTYMETFLFFTFRRANLVVEFTLYDVVGLMRVLDAFENVEKLLREDPQRLFDRALAIVFTSRITRQWEAETTRWSRMSDEELDAEITDRFTANSDDLRLRMRKFCIAFSLNTMERFNTRVLLDAVRMLMLTSSWKNVHERNLICDVANPLKVIQ